MNIQSENLFLYVWSLIWIKSLQAIPGTISKRRKSTPDDLGSSKNDFIATIFSNCTESDQELSPKQNKPQTLLSRVDQPVLKCNRTVSRDKATKFSCSRSQIFDPNFVSSGELGFNIAAANGLCQNCGWTQGRVKESNSCMSKMLDYFTFTANLLAINITSPSLNNFD